MMLRIDSIGYQVFCYFILDGRMYLFSFTRFA